MIRPPLEVADLVRTARNCFHRAQPPVDPLAAHQSPAGHCPLSHRRTRRPYR